MITLKSLNKHRYFAPLLGAALGLGALTGCGSGLDCAGLTEAVKGDMRQIREGANTKADALALYERGTITWDEYQEVREAVDALPRDEFNERTLTLIEECGSGAMEEVLKYSNTLPLSPNIQPLDLGDS